MDEKKDKIAESTQSIEALKLRQFVSQIESLEGQKKEISEEVSCIYNDIKNEGYDISVIKEIIRLRKKDENERLEREIMLEHYKHILNME